MSKKSEKKEEGGNEPPKMKFQTALRVCRSELGDGKRAEAAAAIIFAMNDLDAAAARKRQVMKEFSTEIAAIKETIREMRDHYEENAEYQKAECEWCFDWERGKVTVRRLDTAELVEDRPMSDDEKQHVMDGVDMPMPGALDEE